MNRYVMTAVCLSALAAAACDKPATTETKTEETKGSTSITAGSATGTAATPTTTTPTTVTIDDSDLATPADFEETAEKAITAKNYKAELASLETDVNKE